MSFVNKFFKRKSKKNTEFEEKLGKLAKADGLTLKNIDSSPSKEDQTKYDAATERWLSKLWDDSDDESIGPDFVTPSSSSCNVGDDSVATLRRKQRLRELRQNLNKLKQGDRKRRRYQKESMALDKEIDQVTSLISIVKLQNDALNDDILNKKCELNFLQAEVPDDFEAAAKAREPVMYKKYKNVKSAEDGKKLLITIRQKMKALQYMELLTYDKYLDFHHCLRSNAIQAQSSIMSKNKKRHFGHLTDTIEFKRKSRADKRSHTKMKSYESSSDVLDTITTVTIESPTRELESSPDIVCATPPFSAPPVPPNMYTYVPLLGPTACTPPMESML